MKCIECKQSLNPEIHAWGTTLFGTELCEKHISRLEKLRSTNGTPIEAIKLYYALKTSGVQPMLEWWDGKRFVHLAISRVKLNIEIDTEYQMITPEHAITHLEDAMCSYKNGFTTIRIPHVLIKDNINETLNTILGIIAELKVTVKII